MKIIFLVGFSMVFFLGLIFVILAVQGYGVKTRAIAKKKEDKEVSVWQMFLLGTFLISSGSWLIWLFIR